MLRSDLLEAVNFEREQTFRPVFPFVDSLEFHSPPRPLGFSFFLTNIRFLHPADRFTYKSAGRHQFLRCHGVFNE